MEKGNINVGAMKPAKGAQVKHRETGKRQESAPDNHPATAEKKSGADKRVAASSGKRKSVAKKQVAQESNVAQPEETDADKQVEHALLRKAIGYTYRQQESYKVKLVEYDTQTGKKQCERESVEVVSVEKYALPEFSAIALWLKARAPLVWGDAVQGASGSVVIVDDIPAQTGAVMLAEQSESADWEKTCEKTIVPEGCAAQHMKAEERVNPQANA